MKTYILASAAAALATMASIAPRQDFTYSEFGKNHKPRKFKRSQRKSK